MKVALFTDTFDEVNGVANTFRYLVEYCRRTGRRLDVYAHATDGKDSAEQLDSVRICRYKPSVPLDIYFDMIFDMKLPRLRIFNNFRSRKYDIVHTATPGSIGLHALAAARLEKLPLIGSYHTTLPEYVRVRVDKIVKKFKLPTQQSSHRTENLMWEYMKWYYNQCLLVLAPSQATMNQLQTKLDTPIDIFTRGIDTDRFNPKYRSEPSQVTVLYVGRVSTEKNRGANANLPEQNRCQAGHCGRRSLSSGDGRTLPSFLPATSKS